MFVFSSCEKEFKVNELEFDVVTSKKTYHVNEDVDFQFKGNPDIISFYSGEIKSDYNYKNGRVLNTDLTASFKIKFTNKEQDNQLSVKVSTDLKSYDIADVNAATWTDITDRYTLPTANQSAYNTVGEANLNDLIEEGKPMYYAFRYINRPNAVYGAYDSWEFSTFLMNYKTELEDVILLNQTTAAWKIVLDGSWETGRVVKYSTTLRFIGNGTPIPTDQVAWAISAPVYASPKVDLGADRAIPIKALADPHRDGYNFRYSKPGIYKVTFIAANQNASGRKEVIKQFEIEILP